MKTYRINALFAHPRHNQKPAVCRAVLSAACELAKEVADSYGAPLSDRTVTFTVGRIVARLNGLYDFELHDILNAVQDLQQDDYLEFGGARDFEHLQVSEKTEKLVMGKLTEGEVFAA